MPGLLLFALGFIAAAALVILPVHFGKVTLDVGSLSVASMLVIVGVQLVSLALFTKVFAIAEGLLPEDPKFSRAFRFFTLEKGAILGALALITGAALILRAVLIWHAAGYGIIPFADNLRRLIPAATCIVVGIQIISGSFFLSVLGLKTTSRKPPGK